MYMKTRNIIGLVFVILIPASLSAQIPFETEVEDVPINGGLWLLILAGIGYAIMKFKKQHIKA